MLIAKAITTKITQIVQAHAHSFSSEIFTSSIFSVHFSAELRSNNLSTNFFLHLQFSWFNKYSPMSHDLSHSHSQLLGFIDHLSHTPLSINSLHSHQHLSLFQRCLLL